MNPLETKTNNIISIGSKEDWRTLSCIRGSLDFYLGNNKDGKYDKAIEREGFVYDGLLKKYLKST